MAQRKKTRSDKTGAYAYDGLDRVLHEKARLGILTALFTRAQGILFTDLKGLCSLTDGNLSRHLQVLQEAGLVTVRKGYRHNRPHTTCRMTVAGRRRFQDYLTVLEQVVRDAAEAADGRRRAGQRLRPA